jgi:hypothetical protein
LYTGQRFPDELYRDCAHYSPEKYVVFMDNDEYFVRPVLNTLKTSKSAGKLAGWSTSFKPNEP